MSDEVFYDTSAGTALIPNFLNASIFRTDKDSHSINQHITEQNGKKKFNFSGVFQWYVSPAKSNALPL